MRSIPLVRILFWFYFRINTNIDFSFAEDAVEFYSTPVDTTLPLDAMKTVELPENLYIQHEYIRFHPETDTMFGGKSAFPKSSTIVTGLKYKNKYKGHVAKKSWP